MAQRADTSPLSEDGRHLRSFGAGLNANTSAAVREYANRAQLRVACDLGASRIYVTGVSTGIVRAYTPQGDLIWERELPDFRGNSYALAHQGVAVFYGRHYTSSILRIGSDLLLVQTRQLEPVAASRVVAPGRRSAWEGRAVTSYGLSARTGALVARDDSAPLIGSIMLGTALGYEQDPYPRAFVLQWSERRR